MLLETVEHAKARTVIVWPRLIFRTKARDSCLGSVLKAINKYGHTVKNQTLMQPVLAIYVVWHPDFQDGPQIAESIRSHFREGVHGAGWTSVLFRSAPPDGAALPIPIPLDDAGTTAVIVLHDSVLAEDEAWTRYIKWLSNDIASEGFRCALLPVSIEMENLDLRDQVVRWDLWEGDNTARRARLIREITLEMCRMLRHRLMVLEQPDSDHEDIVAMLEKVRIFLSHSKHDAHGATIAQRIRDALHASRGLASFFDVNDIPAGLHFDRVILAEIRRSAVLAILTDAYSSREWCRREVLEAKRHQVPMVVADCLEEHDPRSFPYLGNVPMLRMAHDANHRISMVIGRLLDEVLWQFIWKCRVAEVGVDPDTTFLPRAPELASLPSANGRAEKTEVVYPDPPLCAQEERLIEAVAPHVNLVSFGTWLAGRTP